MIMATMYEIKDHIINLDQVVWIDKVGRDGNDKWCLNFHLAGQSLTLSVKFALQDAYESAIEAITTKRRRT